MTALIVSHKYDWTPGGLLQMVTAEYIPTDKPGDPKRTRKLLLISAKV